MPLGQKSNPQPPKIQIACVSCKSRKRRCDGGTPQCRNCIARGEECVYATARKKRGPGKKKFQIESPGDPVQLPTNELLNTSSNPNDHPQIDPHLETQTLLPRPEIFPTFLLPETFTANLRTFRSNHTQNQTYTPLNLIPLPLWLRMTTHVLSTVPSLSRLQLTASTFQSHPLSQYSTSPSSPGSDPARWALVNTVLALCIKCKIAREAEGALGCVHEALWKNAVGVLPDLILGERSAEVVLALRVMGIYAKETEDKGLVGFFGGVVGGG
ncbi:uncharacterized protein LY89DRAFT_726259 [Mollisia scopiformis]|uniref:Zn(2)-C6 fungal-type domain-containing protein n=1 Tax=Mollisia scopiformis TaxID=149040 RepID=A0A132B375_MOLSC|nr:uncharacterized protein LY89DRAFT_726259 [Mollisia scopiformis]KUJ06855.1 hypothetical protein LY89DRAFT_726259 [Mollisia scopiformis]